jgi:hypothetical protein
MDLYTVESTGKTASHPLFWRAGVYEGTRFTRMKNFHLEQAPTKPVTGLPPNFAHDKGRYHLQLEIRAELFRCWRHTFQETYLDRETKKGANGHRLVSICKIHFRLDLGITGLQPMLQIAR